MLHPLLPALHTTLISGLQFLNSLLEVGIDRMSIAAIAAKVLAFLRQAEKNQRDAGHKPRRNGLWKVMAFWEVPKPLLRFFTQWANTRSARFLLDPN